MPDSQNDSSTHQETIFQAKDEALVEAKQQVEAAEKEEKKPDQDSKTEPSSTPEVPFSAINYQPPTLAQLQQESRKRNLVVAGVIVIIVILGLLIFSWLANKTSAPKSTSESSGGSVVNQNPGMLSGSITFSRTRPGEDEPGTIEIYYREAKSETPFTATGVSLPLAGQTWSLSDAKKGVAYEVVAYLYHNNQKVAESNIISTNTPASGIVLNFDFDWQTQTSGGMVEGMVKVEGFLPAGSKVLIMEDTPTADGITSVPAFTFEAVAPQMTYSLSGVSVSAPHLYSAELHSAANEKIGASVEKIQVQAGEKSANFTINSTAAPNTTNAGQGSQPQFSGSVSINGPLRANSRVVVSGRPVGAQDYQVWQVLTNLSSHELNWQFSGVNDGSEYNIIASLQVNGETVNTANASTHEAPSNRIGFNLNTNYFLTAPTQQVQINPCVLKGDAWETSIVIPQVELAAQYWLQVGTGGGGLFTTSNADNLYSRKHAATSGPLSIRVGNLSTGKSNVVRFSYAVCQGCGDNSNFSPWSKTISFACQ